ncbi:baseplate J/gp47 family protein [Laribacter hongkongensis]|uniref:baseplate J/gp47 family protein n=1 Tax=Laribacter hongkongensis TaxID=168471 RepID=UPI001EFE38F7|nr:baseplate J/gp47 family protein [Laribacter hongkongensis]MCG9064728.1 baseplate J/gp47 family protein [Laribacter hongkongensis]
MGQLTSHGYMADRLDIIIASLDAGFRGIYGNDINTDPDSPDGQMIGLIAQIRADLEELGETIYRALDPDTASGAWLEQRAAYAALTRRGARYSYLRSVILTGTAHAIIPAGAIVSDGNKVRWQLVSDVTLGTDGSARADFRSELLGAFSVPTDTPLTVETITLGWSGATTSASAEVGAEEETDSDLRARFFRTRARAAQNSVEGIESTISELADVRQVIVLENTGNDTDANGVPGHSLNVIVDGGDDAGIAAVIFKRKTGGTGLMGNISVVVKDARGRSRQVRFDRPDVIECSAYIEVTRRADFTAIDVEAIKAALASESFGIGEDVLLTRLYSPINTVPGFWVSDLRIGRRGGQLVRENIQIGVRELARFAVTDIQVVPK